MGESTQFFIGNWFLIKYFVTFYQMACRQVKLANIRRLWVSMHKLLISCWLWPWISFFKYLSISRYVSSGQIICDMRNYRDYLSANWNIKIAYCLPNTVNGIIMRTLYFQWLHNLDSSFDRVSLLAEFDDLQ